MTASSDLCVTLVIPQSGLLRGFGEGGGETPCFHPLNKAYLPMMAVAAMLGP